MRLNEELRIRRCVVSGSWAGEIFVVVSFSSDSTVELAREIGARVFEHKWEGFSAQRNWALDNLPFSNEWVLFCDADWIIPGELAEEIRASIASATDVITGYYLPWGFSFLGDVLKHAGGYEHFVLCLFRRSAGRYEQRGVHERL